MSLEHQSTTILYRFQPIWEITINPINSSQPSAQESKCPFIRVNTDIQQGIIHRIINIADWPFSLQIPYYFQPHASCQHVISALCRLKQFEKKIKIEFPGNLMKILISPESAWFTDSFSTFGNQKIAHRKKVRRFLIPEFNLNIFLGLELMVSFYVLMCTK